MDEGVAVLVTQTKGFLIGVVVYARHKFDVSAETFCGFHLADWCSFRQTDERLDAHRCSSKRHALCVVAC